ncbi:hypothetical protein B0H16DRAFT_1878520 [Mycena metata]|uniref:Uncharacterized protein n=1 Tax=Mycena metata TaxID=1033252 RepID=A0AAD7K7N5_9AGAR|nr:hypothetical protein B0H16DRAFT_1878520 [Mycena metata]
MAFHRAALISSYSPLPFRIRSQEDPIPLNFPAGRGECTLTLDPSGGRHPEQMSAPLWARRRAVRPCALRVQCSFSERTLSLIFVLISQAGIVADSFPDVPGAPEAIGLTANQIGGTVGAVVGVVLLILWLIWRIRSGVNKRLKEDLEYVEREAAVTKIAHLERELAVATSAGNSVVDPNPDGVNEPPQVAAHTNSPGAPAVARKKQRFRPF